MEIYLDSQGNHSKTTTNLVIPATIAATFQSNVSAIFLAWLDNETASATAYALKTFTAGTSVSDYYTTGMIANPDIKFIEHSEFCRYEKGIWTYVPMEVHLILYVANQSSFAVKKTNSPIVKQELPCKQCQRKCFVDDATCWWCCIPNPTQAQ
jgi:hypothetical protein